MSENGQEAQWQPTEGLEALSELAHDANSALNGVADAVGLTPKVERAPYAMVAAALGVGYVIGGGLLTPTTSKLVRLGLKLAAIPQVRDRLLDVAEAAVDGVLKTAAKAKTPNPSNSSEPMS